MINGRALALELQNAEDEWAQREYMRREQERAAQRRKELVEYDERRLLRQDEGRKEKENYKNIKKRSVKCEYFGQLRTLLQQLR